MGGAARRAAVLGALLAGALPGATLRGRVFFPRAAPDVPPLKVLTEPAVCGGPTKPNESLLVGAEGGLANVVADLADLDAAPATTPATPVMDQVACVFVPHVLMARKRGDVRFENSDATFHNVNAYTVEGHYQAFNLGLPEGVPAITKRLRRPGALVLRCDAGHPWMRAFVWAAEGPAALTDAEGRFELAGVPPGKHRLVLWHEMIGRAEVEVEVPADQDVVEGSWTAQWRRTPAFRPGRHHTDSPLEERPPPATRTALSPTPRTHPPRRPRRDAPKVPLPWVAGWGLAVLSCGALLVALRRRRLQDQGGG